MKKFLLLSILLPLVSAFSTYAQMPLMKAVTDKVNSLKQAGIDTIVTYHPYCVGCVLIGISGSDTCYHSIRQYVIWKQKGEGYVQFFDECYTYQPKKGAPGFIALLSKNTAAIMQEKILPVEFEKMVDGKIQRLTSWRDHSDHQDFTLYVKDNKVELPVDRYNLDTRWEGDNFSPNDKLNGAPLGRAININYAKNQKTYLKKLVDLVEQEIENVKFQRVL